MHPARILVRALGAVAFAALVATSLPRLESGANAAAPATTAPALDLANLDPTCKACDDFYQFATGGWSKTHTLPSGRARWGSFDELAQRNRDILHDILEADAKERTRRPAATRRSSARSTARAWTKRASSAPARSRSRPLLAAIDAVHDVPALETAIARVQRSGVDTGLGFSARPDTKDSSKQIAAVGLGGLGMGDRDAYFNTGERAEKIRAAYHDYVAAQFANLGDEPAKAKAEADQVIALETALATATPKRADMRDPYKLYNPTPVAQLSSLAPHVAWKSMFTAAGTPPFDTINVTVPGYVKAYDQQLATTPVDAWKAFLRFHVADAYAGALPKRFEDASFAFRSGVLVGVKEQLPRWQRCTVATDAALRDPLGRAYVATAFPPAAKARAQALVDNLQSTCTTTSRRSRG